MPQPLHLQSHPLWSIKRRIVTPAGEVVRPVLGLHGRELLIHGPDAAHAVERAMEMGYAGGLFAEVVS